MKKLFTYLLATLPIALFGHGGHGSIDPNSILHYFGTIQHALPIAGLAMLVVGALVHRKKRIVS